jgi:hypothetical protein
MEPRHEEPKAPTPQPEEKSRRFRIVKLEERIAPSGGHGHTHTCPPPTFRCGTTGCHLSIE